MNLENKKQVATIALAVGLGLFAAFLMSQYINGSIQEQTQRLAEQYKKQTAPLIQEVQTVRGEMDKMRKEQAQLAKQVKEQKVVVQAGPATQAQTAVAMEAFSIHTPPGKRAFTIRIEALSAVGGLIAPGDVVDILAQLKVPQGDDDKKKQGVTTILFQNIQVLAVGTNYQPAAKATQYVAQQKAKDLNVTLALDAEQAGLLAFVQQHGKLMLSLRSPTEERSEIVQVASWDALADYVMDHQGTELIVPEKKADVKAVGKTEKTDSEVKPLIQIFKSGKESNF